MRRQFPFELLLTGLNFFSLGHELRAAFSRLLNDLYLGCYPHTPLPRPRRLFLVPGFAEADPHLCEDRESASSMDRLIPRFAYLGNTHTILGNSVLRLELPTVRLPCWLSQVAIKKNTRAS